MCFQAQHPQVENCGIIVFYYWPFYMVSSLISATDKRLRVMEIFIVHNVFQYKFTVFKFNFHFAVVVRTSAVWIMNSLNLKRYINTCTVIVKLCC